MASKKRLIDANALMDDFRKYMVERYDREKCVSEENCKTCENSCLWRKKVRAAPTVDAVEVVRCKDCRHFLAKDGYTHIDGFCYAGNTTIARKAESFCSYGERREGE